MLASRPALWLLLALPLALGARQCPDPGVWVLAAPDSATTWQRFEALAAVTYGGGNAFDPAVVDVRGEFAAPDGRLVEMPAFATQNFDRSLVGSFERLRQTSAIHWRVRFLPDAPGRWRWRLVARTPGGEAATDWSSLEVAPPGPGDHGPLRVSARDPRYLRFEDGTPYFAIGENLCWYDGRGTFAYDAWLDALAAQGANYIRLWMPSWAFGIEWTTLGDYGDRLDRAWQLDHVMAAAAERGIQVMLAIQNHGPFSLSANSQWADNPYNAAHGGPLAAPREFFTNGAARELFRRRLRYVVARWGAEPNLLAWELWNEVNLADPPGGTAVRDWHAEMAAVLRALDPWDRLITTSVSLGAETSPLWLLDDIDFTQSHSYNWPFFLDHAPYLETLNRRTRIDGKPSLIGEMGSDFRGPAETLATDPSHIGFHDGVWIGVLSGTFGTGMTWWWDNVIDPNDLYGVFGAVSAFVAGVAFDAQAFEEARPEASSAVGDLTAWALVGEGVVLAWLKNLDHHFSPAGNPGDPTLIREATLTLEGLADGAWSVRWFDTRSGAVTASEDVVSAAGIATLVAPDFRFDVALRLDRR